MKPLINRRKLLMSMGAFACVPQMVKAEDYIDLEWADLLPAEQSTVAPILEGIIQHDQASLADLQPQSNGVRTDWNGKIVRLPGFVLPVEYAGTGVTAFILVPFIGACVHVPPPPSNQLVFVTTSTPYEVSNLYEPVSVIGMFGVSSMSTQLADIAYALSADRIEPYSI